MRGISLVISDIERSDNSSSSSSLLIMFSILSFRATTRPLIKKMARKIECQYIYTYYATTFDLD